MRAALNRLFDYGKLLLKTVNQSEVCCVKTPLSNLFSCFPFFNKQEDKFVVRDFFLNNYKNLGEMLKIIVNFIT